jgi:hypothetical protein
MLRKLVYDRFWDTDPCSTILKHININDNIRILGYDDEPIRDINWFYYLMDGLDKKAFTHGGFGLRASVHTKNVALLKEMTYRWFLTTYCKENDYDIRWNIIENTEICTIFSLCLLTTYSITPVNKNIKLKLLN